MKARERKLSSINRSSIKDRICSYLHHPFSFVCMLLVMLGALLTVGVLFAMIFYILVNGIPYLKPELFSLTYTSENASMFPAIVNTITMTLLSLLIAVPFSVFTAIYLVEYAKRGNKLVGVIRTTAETLSGIPSIVYGLFGMLFFVTYLGWGTSLLAGAMTLSIMILPLIMRTTEEALLSVPDTFREASFGLGAGRLRTILRVVLPSAVPGILAGVILGIGRIVGETAALIYTAGTSTDTPHSLMDSGRTLSIHMYVLSGEGFHTNEAFATAVVLLITVLGIPLGLWLIRGPTAPAEDDSPSFTPPASGPAPSAGADPVDEAAADISNPVNAPEGEEVPCDEQP